MLFHVWFSTKYEDALQGELREDVLAGFRDVAREKGIDLLEAEAQFDHVHLLLRIEDESELPRAMMHLKGITARRLLQEYAYLTMTMGTLNFWQRVTFVAPYRRIS